MSDNKSSQHAEEMEQIKELVFNLQNDADTNYHWLLLKRWGLLVVALLSAFIVGVVSAHFVQNPHIQITDDVTIKNMAPTIFNVTITICGIMIGFVPVISFFFVGEIRKLEHDLKEEIEKIRKNCKGDELNLIDSYDKLSFMRTQNFIAGVLKYTRDFVIVSVFLLIILVVGYVYFIGHGLDGFSVSVNLVSLAAVATGIFPIVTIALYKPTLRLVRYVIPKEEFLKIEVD